MLLSCMLLSCMLLLVNSNWTIMAQILFDCSPYSARGGVNGPAAAAAFSPAHSASLSTSSRSHASHDEFDMELTYITENFLGKVGPCECRASCTKGTKEHWGLWIWQAILLFHIVLSKALWCYLSEHDRLSHIEFHNSKLHVIQSIAECVQQV